MKKPIRYTTFAEALRIGDKLREVVILNDDGTCTYKPGWDDKAVVRAIDPTGELNARHVERVRVGAFGTLRRPSKAGVEAELADLKRKVAALSLGFTNLEATVRRMSRGETSATMDTIGRDLVDLIGANGGAAG